MAFFNGKDTEKAKLQRQLLYYTNLISKHEKLQLASETVSTKDKNCKVFEKPFQISLQTKNGSSNMISPAANEFKSKPFSFNVNTHKRIVVQKKFTNNVPNPPHFFPKRIVIAPTQNKNKANLPFATSINKVNSIQPHIVLHNKKTVVPNTAVNASNRSVLLPEVAKNSLSKSNSFTKSKDIGKLRADSMKHIEELKELAKQLELKKKKLSLVKSRIATTSSVKTCSVSVRPILPSTNKSLIRKPELTEKINGGNIVVNCPIVCKNLSDKMPKAIIDLPKNNKLTTSSAGTINVETPCSIMRHKSLENKSNLPSTQKSEMQGNDATLQHVKNPQLAQLLNDLLPSLGNVNLKTPNSLLKGKCILENKLSISSKLISKMSNESLTKLVNSQKPNVSTPIAKRAQKPSSAKKRGHMTKLVASKYKVVNKRLSPAVSSKNRLSEANLLGTNKDPSTNLVTIQKTVQGCVTTPLAVGMKDGKVNSVKKKENMAVLTASKYKVVNKKIQNSPAVCSKIRFSKNRQEEDPQSFSKWYPPVISKTPNIKRLHSNYKIVNLVKTPKRPNNSLLKSPFPKFVKKGKYVLKRRKLDTSISANTPKLRNTPNTILLKTQFQHTKGNYLVSSNSKKSKLNLSMKLSACSTLKSKYKVINRCGLSKKSPKSSSSKHSAVYRTKSGVDIDLLREMAAESTENESSVNTLKNKSVLSKRVYKSKNAIVNTNICSVTGAKIARGIKAKYLMNKNMWPKQVISRKFFGTKYHKGHRFIADLQRSPTTKFFKRNNFKFPAPSQKHKLVRSYKASQYGKTNGRIFNYRNEHLRTLQNQLISTPISKVLANRVLHQSINRVISASAKKKLSKINTYCMFYNRFGRCNKGLKCTYVHDPSKIAVCTRFLRGTCKKDNCLFSHEISPGKMAICSFFLLGSCMKSDCPYRHETLSPNAELCKAFVQGYCPEGNKCKKAHVLVCPHFIQGLCGKGDTCAFPHPPSKEKKMPPKSIEKKEMPMEVDDLMERVSRYFQPTSEQIVVLETNKTTVVPRRQKLPEQPSFIAL